MSAAAPSYRLPADPKSVSRPFSWRLLLSRFRGTFSEVLRHQADILRRAGTLSTAGEVDLLRREAAAAHEAARERLRVSLFTPFDAEDLSEILLGVAKVVRARHRILLVGKTAFAGADQVATGWAQHLADLIPALPERSIIDRRSNELRGFDTRLRRQIRLAQAQTFTGEPAEAMAQQEERRRFQALHLELRRLTLLILRVRYRNG